MPAMEERVAFIEGQFQGMRDSLAGIERRFDHVEHRMDRLEHRFDVLEEKMSRQFLWIVGIQITAFVAVVGAVLSRG